LFRGAGRSFRARRRSNMTGETNGWKSILDGLTLHHGDRIAASKTNLTQSRRQQDFLD